MHSDGVAVNRRTKRSGWRLISLAVVFNRLFTRRGPVLSSPGEFDAAWPSRIYFVTAVYNGSCVLAGMVKARTPQGAACQARELCIDQQSVPARAFMTGHARVTHIAEQS